MGKVIARCTPSWEKCAHTDTVKVEKEWISHRTEWCTRGENSIIINHKVVPVLMRGHTKWCKCGAVVN
jgi:hypothetical protein